MQWIGWNKDAFAYMAVVSIIHSIPPTEIAKTVTILGINVQDPFILPIETVFGDDNRHKVFI
jgi:hypothetical protein